jgi:hypothetical protein
MNSRRFMSDMGFLPHRPTSRHERTGRLAHAAIRRMLSLPRSDRHVLGADLNRSESGGAARCSRASGRLVSLARRGFDRPASAVLCEHVVEGLD